jgi:hypothetical protein
LDLAKKIKTNSNSWAWRESNWAAQRVREMGRNDLNGGNGPVTARLGLNCSQLAGATWRYLGRPGDRAAYLLRRVDGTLGCRRVRRRRCRGSPRLATGANDSAEDGESSGGRGWSGEAWSRRLRRATAAAGSGQIPARGELIGEGRWSRLTSEVRRSCWCEGNGRGSSPFIGG